MKLLGIILTDTSQQTHDVHAMFSQGCVSVGGKVTK